MISIRHRFIFDQVGRVERGWPPELDRIAASDPFGYLNLS